MNQPGKPVTCKPRPKPSCVPVSRDRWRGQHCKGGAKKR